MTGARIGSDASRHDHEPRHGWDGRQGPAVTPAFIGLGIADLAYFTAAWALVVGAGLAVVGAIGSVLTFESFLPACSARPPSGGGACSSSAAPGWPSAPASS